MGQHSLALARYRRKTKCKKKSETELEHKLKDEPEAPVASQGATYYENLKCAAVLLSLLLNMIA